ncbi:arginase family protein [Limnochorda pilosa]|uniref:Arginase n=1 Tax=Limnochorda pilosa TaxID=1555112 RepID=A0A0K2SIG4_LIMPI|nr:arginase family protein [Limnochorda pilosa]BAS26898.1 hypothetical protein LIP_1041 [Limnochorda pilosa]
MLQGIAVLDTGGAITRQVRLLKAHPTTFVTLHPPARTYRFFLHHAQLPRLARRLSPVLGRVTFLGTGEYHHLTAALLHAVASAAEVRPAAVARAAFGAYGTSAAESARPPGMGLVVLDAHPEWSIAPAGYVHCGSWLPHVLSQPWLRAVALVGVGALETQGMLDPRVLFGVQTAVRSGRLSVHPARRSTARAIAQAFGPVDVPASLEDGVDAVVADVLTFLGPGPAYLSIDKDVVAPEELPNAWGGGELSVGETLRLVEGLLAGGLEPAGADVCGEWEPSFGFAGRTDPVLLRHEAFNLRLLERLLPGRAAPRAGGRRHAGAEETERTLSR